MTPEEEEELIVNFWAAKEGQWWNFQRI
jgi:hypothetical protein